MHMVFFSFAHKATFDYTAYSRNEIKSSCSSSRNNSKDVGRKERNTVSSTNDHLAQGSVNLDLRAKCMFL